MSQREHHGPAGSQLEILFQEWPVPEVLPGVQEPAVCRQENCSQSISYWAGGDLKEPFLGFMTNATQA